jgi:hypothetical protein
MRSLFLASIALLITDPLLAQGSTRVAGYETYAVVAPIADAAEAIRLAQLHCATYARFAHFRRMDGLKAIFDCEPRRIDRAVAPTSSRGLY